MKPEETPAIHGGPPAVTSPPPIWPEVDENDRRALLDVLESRVWGGYHPAVGDLERRMASLHGATFGIAVANGTLSLEIALTAAGVRPGDEVIVPPITFVASASAIARVGAVPVFVDVDPETINLDLERPRPPSRSGRVRSYRALRGVPGRSRRVRGAVP
jgi:dTDP-4-amino-4,6-dideoxygalactose transaminase